MPLRIVIQPPEAPSPFPKSKVSLINQSVTANQDILSSDIEPTNTPCIFRIYVVPSGFAPVFYVARKVSDTTILEALNLGNALQDKRAYLMDIIVDSGEKINFRCDSSGTLAKLSVTEWDINP